MKIGITGASGQLGKIVLDKLKLKTPAENIVALVRDPQKVSGEAIEVRAFDYEKPELLAEALSGIDKLVLISGNEIGKRAAQHANVIEAAKHAGVKLIVYTSLLRANNTTISLAGEHLKTEKDLKASGLSYVILRNGWYTENYTASIQDVLALGTLYGCAGEGKTSSASREDFAEAVVAVLTSEGHTNKTYELAGDEAFTLSEYAATLSQVSGKNIPYVNLPEEDYAKALSQAGLPEFFAAFLAGAQTSTAKGDLYEPGRQLSKLIGRPTTPFRETIAQALKN